MSKKNGIDIPCSHCGKLTHRSESRISRAKHFFCSVFCSNSQKNNPAWKEKLGYKGIHAWMYRNFGRPKKCDHCGAVNKNRYDWANISNEYKRDRSDWLRLCASCHKKYDWKKKKEVSI